MINPLNNISSSDWIVYEKNLQQSKDLVDPVVKELNIQKDIQVGFSRAIDPNMAGASGYGIYVCPLFTVELESIPTEIRPLNSDDPRLFNLNFVQRLSDWLAHTFQLKAETVTLMHIAACKTILRLRENPEHFKLAINAGIAHELAHIILNHEQKIIPAWHCTIPYNGKWHLLNPKKWICIWNYLKAFKQNEREADAFASTHLKNGVEGIEIGCRAWQASLIALRQNKALGWRDRLLMKLTISPKGNPLPLYFTHGTFDQRIKWAREDYESMMKKE